MLNTILSAMIIVASFALFSDEIFPQQSPQSTAKNAQAGCYARILGIPTPKVINHAYSAGGLLGSAGKSFTGRPVVKLYKGHNQSTLAHEIRHTWQFAQGWNYEHGIPHHKQRAEIDAENWASNNWHRCPLN